MLRWRWIKTYYTIFGGTIPQTTIFTGGITIPKWMVYYCFNLIIPHLAINNKDYYNGLYHNCYTTIILLINIFRFNHIYIPYYMVAYHIILFYTIPKYGITIPKWMVYQNILYHLWDCEDPEKTSGWSFPSHRPRSGAQSLLPAPRGRGPSPLPWFNAQTWWFLTQERMGVSVLKELEIAKDILLGRWFECYRRSQDWKLFSIRSSGCRIPICLLVDMQ